MSPVGGKLNRGFDRLLEWVPSGVELHALRALVADDLVGDEDLAAVVGPRFEVGHAEIPRIRPILVAVAARATGAVAVDEEAQHAAELLHLALRVHDLALGREGGRRRRVARRLVRRSMGWLVGNHLTLRALELSRHSQPGVLEELMETLRAFSDAQALSRELIGQMPEEEDWLEHADAHTGALFAFCCRVGGHLGGAPIQQLGALGRYGRHVGRLWHIAEDISALAHGEPALHLIARAAAGRPVLPVICAAERDAGVATDWIRLAIEPDPEQARALSARVALLGVGASREIMLRESWRARKALAALPDSRYRAAMDRLAGEIARACIRPPACTDGAPVSTDGAPVSTDKALEGPREALKGPREALEGPREALKGPREALKGPGEALEGPREALKGPREALEGPGEALKGPREALKGPGEAPEGPREAPEGPREAPEGPGAPGALPGRAAGAGGPTVGAEIYSLHPEDPE